MNHKEEREKDFQSILNSVHPRKVVVGGPGTGKTYLFEQIIKKKNKEGKNNFLAITFVGKLGDFLADDLAGLAKTMTMHGFARKFVLDHCPAEWGYYPKISNVIEEDLAIKGVSKFQIGDSNYKQRTKYYKTVGEDDVVHYAIEICKKDNNKIPEYDLILVDEFQDFNAIEAEFIDLLATKNEILIVGDDDQALYGFKGSHPRFIRKKCEKGSIFESHTLRFCSRCTEVIVSAFDDILCCLDKKKIKDRIPKEYISYAPEKKEDNDSNTKIIVFEDLPLGMIPIKIIDELRKILEEQKIKSVLILGEARSCQKILLSITKKLQRVGFKNVDSKFNKEGIFSFKQYLIEAYKLLSKRKSISLAWRLLIREINDETEIEKIILDSYDDPESFIKSLPDKFKKEHNKKARTIQRILEEPDSKVKAIAESSMMNLADQIIEEKKKDREILINQLRTQNSYISRPLANLDITVCSILGAKGLGADVVFLVGFDQGKLPLTKKVTDSEVYQMLVSLTRSKKRTYLINTGGVQVSQFLNHIRKELYEKKMNLILCDI